MTFLGVDLDGPAAAEYEAETAMLARPRSLLRPLSPSQIALAALLPAALVACGGAESVPAARPPGAPAATAPTSAAGPKAMAPAARIDRERFNHAAFSFGEPIFWESDADGDGRPSPNEVRTLLFYGDVLAPKPSPLPARHVAPERIDRVLARLAAAPPARDARLLLIEKENAQLRPILVASDLRDLAPSEKELVRHLFAATHSVDRIHARQRGMLPKAAAARQLDPESAALYRRNWGPRCGAPLTEGEAGCTAMPGEGALPVDTYPAALQKDPKFCVALEKADKQAAGSKLLDPFTMVREENGKLVPLPLAEAKTAMPDGSFVSYRDDTEAAAKSLEAAATAAAVTDAPLATYLRAAARAFRDGSWFAADEAWAAMAGTPSRFYVRVGPDETYWEPCSHKAGFHIAFARLDPASLDWQKRLEPVKPDLEAAIAKAAGAPYVARKVAFHLPEFINVVWNGGDSRDAIGATIGQSLPNWGPVAEKNRGRTVAMANLYTDADSRRSREQLAASLLCQDAMKSYPRTNAAGLLATILHEATHNLGPAQEYRVRGKTSEALLGGGLASTMEELKAQSGALFFLSLLEARGILDAQAVRESATDSIVWAFGHVSRGMVTPTGERKPYSQLAAIQLGVLADEGALSFAATESAANGKDKGCFRIIWPRFSAAAEKLMVASARPKALGDRTMAEALAKKYVDAAAHHDVIRERMLREPRPSFVYSVDLGE